MTEGGNKESQRKKTQKGGGSRRGTGESEKRRTIEGGGKQLQEVEVKKQKRHTRMEGKRIDRDNYMQKGGKEGG